MRLASFARFALALGCLCVAPCAEAQHGDPKTVPGTWRVLEREAGSTPAEQSLSGQLGEIAALFRALPSLNPPVGFTVKPRIALTGRDPQTKMLKGDFSLLLINHSKKQDGTVDASGTGEGLSVAVAANDVECFLGQGSLAHFEDHNGPLYFAPVVGSFRGAVTYNDCVFLTKRAAPPFVPASRERVMKIVIEQFHELPEMAKALQARLEAMPAAERAAPAWMDMTAYVALGMERKLGAPLFGAPGQKDNDGMAFQALVQMNPALFDVSRPGDIQAMTFSPACSARYRKQSSWCAGFGEEFDKIENTFNFAALSALLK